MKKLDLTGKEKAELEKLLIKTKNDCFDLKMQNSMGKLKNSKGILEKRREIARIMTKMQSEGIKV